MPCPRLLRDSRAEARFKARKALAAQPLHRCTAHANTHTPEPTLTPKAQCRLTMTQAPESCPRLGILGIGQSQMLAGNY